MLAEILGWVATLFRGAGMLAKRANMVKYLVSIGNLFWMLNGVFTGNVPLIVSNGFCLLVMLYEIIKQKKGNKQILANYAKTCKDERKFKVGDWVLVPAEGMPKVVQIKDIEYSQKGQPKYWISENEWLDDDTDARLWAEEL